MVHVFLRSGTIGHRTNHGYFKEKGDNCGMYCEHGSATSRNESMNHLLRVVIDH